MWSENVTSGVDVMWSTDALPVALPVEITQDDVSVVSMSCVGVAMCMGMHALMNRRTVPKREFWAIKLFHYVCNAAIVLALLFLDSTHTGQTAISLPFKILFLVYANGLVDMYHSKVASVPFSDVYSGIAGMVVGLLLVHVLGDMWYLGNEHYPMRIFTTAGATVQELAGHYAMFLGMLVGILVFSELLFNPVHRILHSPMFYAPHHKKHHKYTTELCTMIALVSEFGDNVIMMVLTQGFIPPLKGALLDWGVTDYWCNLPFYLYVLFGMYGHASDARLSNLFGPFPTDPRYNFITYHQHHHHRPKSNCGGTPFFDYMWDKMLPMSAVLTLGAAHKKAD